MQIQLYLYYVGRCEEALAAEVTIFVQADGVGVPRAKAAWAVACPLLVRAASHPATAVGWTLLAPAHSLKHVKAARTRMQSGRMDKTVLSASRSERRAMRNAARILGFQSGVRSVTPLVPDARERLGRDRGLVPKLPLGSIGQTVRTRSALSYGVPVGVSFPVRDIRRSCDANQS